MGVPWEVWHLKWVFQNRGSLLNRMQIETHLRNFTLSGYEVNTTLTVLEPLLKHGQVLACDALARQTPVFEWARNPAPEEHLQLSIRWQPALASLIGERLVRLYNYINMQRTRGGTRASHLMTKSTIFPLPWPLFLLLLVLPHLYSSDQHLKLKALKNVLLFPNNGIVVISTQWDRVLL